MSNFYKQWKEAEMAIESRQGSGMLCLPEDVDYQIHFLNS